MGVVSMGLFDKLFGRGNEMSEEDAIIEFSKSIIPQESSEIEKAIAEKAAHLSEYKKIPLAEVAGLGGIFAELTPALRTVASTVTFDGLGYMPINNLGGEALKFFAKDTPNIYAGAFKSVETGKSVMAQFIKLGPQTVTSTAVMPINPVLMGMAVMMVQINKKLDAIQKTQKEILSFLQEDKKAEIQGDLNMLTDILDKYKYNWENEQYRNNYHMKALDIKQSSEKNIIFYQKQIADKIKSLPAVYLDKTIRELMDKIADDLHDYSMALYLFSFASYLEVMLLGNFSENYLTSVAQRVRDYQDYYLEQVEKCCEYIADVSGDSVQMKVQGAVGKAGKFLGNLIGSTALINKGPVDEWLIENGEQLLQGKEDKIKNIVEGFYEKQDKGSQIFVDSIQNVMAVSNETEAIMFDRDYLYLVA